MAGTIVLAASFDSTETLSLVVGCDLDGDGGLDALLMFDDDADEDVILVTVVWGSMDDDGAMQLESVERVVSNACGCCWGVTVVAVV